VSWSGLRVTVSGIRDLHPDDVPVVRRIVGEVARERPACIVFGGARGTDTVALLAAAQNAPEIERLVIVPGWIDDQPRDAAAAIRECATEVRQLRLPLAARSSFQIRNLAMLDAADALLAFWDGAKGGTANTIAAARRRGMRTEVVRVRRLRPAHGGLAKGGG